MLLMLLLVTIQDAPSLDAAVADYRQRTRADVPCRATDREDEIVVCARRDADRYRVPLTTSYQGPETSSARLGRLLSADAAGFVPCGKGAFMVHCGSVGVGVSVDSGGHTRVAERPLAP